MNQESLYVALETKLTGAAGLTAMVSTRIYGVRAPSTTPTYPYVRFWLVDAMAEGIFGLKDLEHCQVQVDCFVDSTYLSDLSAVVEQVKSALDNQTLTFAGSDYTSIFLRRTNSRNEIEERIQHGIILYTMTVQETS